MTRILTLLIALAVPPAFAWQPPELPSREDLPGSDDRSGMTVSSSTAREELRRLILSTATDRARYDAALAWTDLGLHDPAGQATHVVDTVKLIDALFKDAGDALYRRAVIFRLFSATVADVRDKYPFAASMPKLRAQWKELRRVRDRGLTDKDAVLAAYFERYKPLAGHPPWEKERRRSLLLADKVVADDPARKDALRQAVTLCLSVEKAQQEINDRVQPSIKDPKMKSAYASVCEYRLYSVWANLFRRVVRELVGPKDAARLGVVVKPVKLGWPAYD